ncbi:MAG: hypothetical protein PVI54_04935 [Desulfobacteraceae bacterium]|jgi:hypothetical protein
MENAGKTRSAPSLFQRRLSLLLLALLALIGGAVLWIQNRYDPAAWGDRPGPASSQPDSKAVLPEGLTPLSPAERYTPENLSDKINGKADLYLVAGFKTLETRRLALISDKNRWMERFVYDMGGHQNAFSVYSVQRRKDTQDIDGTPNAYLSANGLFMVHGPFYLEIIATEATPEMQSRMRALATAFVASHPVKPQRLPLLELFPTQNQIPHSTRLIADSAFGIQPLDWVYTAMYAAGDAQAMVYISKRGSPAQARALAGQCMAYWNEYGAQAVQTPKSHAGVQIAFILDNYEIAAVEADYLYGVHEATDLDFALALISQIQQLIPGAQK